MRPRLLALLTVASIACASLNAAAQTEQLPTILITRQLAAAEGLRVGDTVTLAAKPDGVAARKFRVAGIYEPVPDPMRLAVKRMEARLHLPDLLAITADPSDPLSTESITAINVALKDPSDAGAFARDVSATIPIPQLTTRPTQGGEGTATVFVVLDRFHFAIAMVTVIASTMFLLALMVMLVEERRESVGILRLIGLRKSRILLQVFAEGLSDRGRRSHVRHSVRRGDAGRRQRLLSVEVRHRTGLRPHHSDNCPSMRASRGTTRRAGERDFVVDAASQQRPGPRPQMSPFAFALRGLVRQPGRAILGIAGIAATGALLFDMLMLSQGLVISMERLLEWSRLRYSRVGDARLRR